MNIHQAFPSTYIRPDDLQGRPLPCKITAVKYETVGKDQRLVVRLEGTSKLFVLNKTNASTIAMRYGTETDSWAGGDIVLYPSQTEYQGKLVPCIRVKVLPRNGGASPANVMPSSPQAQQPPSTPPAEAHLVDPTADLEPDYDP